MHQRCLAGNELGIEGRVVIGEQGFLRLDEQVFHLLELGRILLVDRIALGEFARRHQPAVGRQHGRLALDGIGRLEQVQPAVRRILDEIGAIAKPRRAPGIGHRESVAGIVGERRRLRVEIGKVRHGGLVDRCGEPLPVQDFGEGRGNEDDVIALAAARHQLAHDLLVGGMVDHLDFQPRRSLELLRDIGRHVAGPVRDDEIGGGCRTRRKACGSQRRGRAGRSQSVLHGHGRLPCFTLFQPLRRARRFSGLIPCRQAVLFRKKIRQ